MNRLVSVNRIILNRPKRQPTGIGQAGSLGVNLFFVFLPLLHLGAFHFDLRSNLLVQHSEHFVLFSKTLSVPLKLASNLKRFLVSALEYVQPLDLLEVCASFVALNCYNRVYISRFSAPAAHDISMKNF